MRLVALVLLVDLIGLELDLLDEAVDVLLVELVPHLLREASAQDAHHGLLAQPVAHDFALADVDEHVGLRGEIDLLRDVPLVDDLRLRLLVEPLREAHHLLLAHDLDLLVVVLAPHVLAEIPDVDPVMPEVKHSLVDDDRLRNNSG